MAILHEARQSAAEALKLAPTSQGCRGRSRACVCHGRRYGTSRVLGTRLRETLPAGHADAVALAACDSGAIGAGQKEPDCRLECPASSFSHRVGREFRSSTIFPASIQCMYAERHTWQPDKAAPPPPSSRRFSTTAALSGTAGRERWRIWEWLVPTPCSREPRRVRMPMPPASGHSPPTKISSPSGKTPTPTSPSSSKPKPSTRSCNSPRALCSHPAGAALQARCGLRGRGRSAVCDHVCGSWAGASRQVSGYRDGEDRTRVA